MRAVYNTKAPKRAVNLSLNADLVVQARGVTNNLSEVVESLLANFVASARAQREARAMSLKESVATWNTFAKKHGSFADEHSTL